MAMSMAIFSTLLPKQSVSFSPPTVKLAPAKLRRIAITPLSKPNNDPIINPERLDYLDGLFDDPVMHFDAPPSETPDSIGGVLDDPIMEFDPPPPETLDSFDGLLDDDAVLNPPRVSLEMQEFLGVSEITGAEALKLVWKYIVDNDLGDPEDDTVILCDEKLKKLFGHDRVGFLVVGGLMRLHFPNEHRKTKPFPVPPELQDQIMDGRQVLKRL